MSLQSLPLVCPLCWTRGPRAGPASRPTGTEWQVATTRTAGLPAEASRCPLEEEEKRGNHNQRASSKHTQLAQGAHVPRRRCGLASCMWQDRNLQRPPATIVQRQGSLIVYQKARVQLPVVAPAFVAQLAEHRTLNAKVAGSYPVDSLQSAMPQRSGAPLRMECNSQAGSTPVVDTSSHGVTVTQEVLIL